MPIPTWGNSVFQGSQSINMDAKGRMAIPSKYRDLLSAACGGRLIITANPYEKCLNIYPEPQWREVSAKISALPNSNKQVRRLQRLVLGNATELELDGNGRVLLPSILRDFAKLDKKLVLVGLNEKAELWSEESWNALLDEDDDAPLPDELLSLSL
ncbi:division/cell wall cluster transcriptional repressor MraZ [Aestuariicella hydrocarbonica]|uniref:Transcriptional regulator MraZ n=1 Tax=Pseudomaricurvus hydrocarbonicus TaxID=1470433 RepID=A0A9E5JT96_9GAMM|nr:division/cell wall cluster transcriptional repressor MraZ [Aestuariicella hydrocarbonica]NHO65071.1 division/cell wall cluster transcriptional repressor MraZ [Aestuariicella hydrocarbonica]